MPRSPVLPDTTNGAYDDFCKHFNESMLAQGSWGRDEDRTLLNFQRQGFPIYPVEHRPTPRKNAVYDHHPLFNFAYVAMRNDGITERSWPRVLKWWAKGEPLNVQERRALGHMALQRLNNEQSWYEEGLRDESVGRLAEVDHVLSIAQDLGWTFQDHSDDRAWKKSWATFLKEHPIGSIYHVREEGRVLRQTLADTPLVNRLPRSRL